jgi:hypothetical protein
MKNAKFMVQFATCETGEGAVHLTNPLNFGLRRRQTSLSGLREHPRNGRDGISLARQVFSNIWIINNHVTPTIGHCSTPESSFELELDATSYVACIGDSNAQWSKLCTGTTGLLTANRG